MSATQEIKSIKRLGIIAGRGSLPAYLVSICKRDGIEPFIIGFHGQTPESLMHKTPHHMWVSLGCAGKIIEFFKDNQVSDLVLIGGITRPAWNEIRPDFKGIQILSRIGLKAMGDNSLLSAIKAELQNEGFELHGIHKFCDKLLMQKGAIGKYQIPEDDQETVNLGINTSQAIGALDIGQSVIVQNGMVIGVEAIEGTDTLIDRCSPLLRKGHNGILVKTCKPQQDQDLDLPTIGVETVINAHKAGLTGIILQAEKVLIIDPQSIAEYADKYKIFIAGVEIPSGNQKH
ncbi:MAG: LpxI family protein [Alphaproteobacteria bacterium]